MKNSWEKLRILSNKAKSFKMHNLTHRIIKSCQIGISIMQPFIKLHRIIRRITFTVGGKTKHSQWIRNLFQVNQFFLKLQPQESNSVSRANLLRRQKHDVELIIRFFFGRNGVKEQEIFDASITIISREKSLLSEISPVIVFNAFMIIVIYFCFLYCSWRTPLWWRTKRRTLLVHWRDPIPEVVLY